VTEEEHRLKVFEKGCQRDITWYEALISPYLITASNYLAKPCAALPGVNRLRKD
jgi:hypothetical protein